MDFLAKLAEGFINLFNLGGQTFMGLVTGIIPTLVVSDYVRQRIGQHDRRR